MQSSPATATLRSIRRNHIGTFTATLEVSTGGRIFGWGATKDAALAAANRRLDNLNAVRSEARS